MYHLLCEWSVVVHLFIKVNDCFAAYEDGAEPDHPFSIEYFYDDEAIYNFVHSL